MTRRDLYFHHAVSSLSRVLRPSPNGFVCPICLRIFESRSDVTREHVPQKAIGGTQICITCRDCNSSAGHTVDVAVHREKRFGEILAPGAKAARGRYTIGEITLPAEISRDEGGVKIVGVPKASDPRKVAAIVKSLSAKASGVEFTLSFSSRHTRRQADIGYLKSAYLAAFSKFGYRWALQNQLDIVRKQIGCAQDTLIPRCRIYFGEEGTTPQLALFLLARPIRALLVKIARNGVLLPWIDEIDRDVFAWLEGNYAPQGKITFKSQEYWSWPRTFELALDQLPPSDGQERKADC